MKLSIVIPTKNEEATLPALFETINAQAFRDFEVIVADAHSTDRTREIAAAFGAKVVDGGMPGPGRNRGAEVANGDILLFVDADVKFPNESFLKDVIAEFEEREVHVATCRLKPMTKRWDDKFGHAVFNNYAKLFERVRAHAAGSCIIARRAVHEAIKGFDERVVFAEDQEYVQRALKQGHCFRLLESHPMLVSVRRLDKDGRLAIAGKYLYSEAHMLLKGPMFEHMFEYRFAHFDRPKD
ncbi:glycosyltransferase [Patescibacteria group bacterium]|jgi:glycosyltransferase involved in cell wall biosynthesis|nr:glycosyltransferase [Patescibacteria group bacterium]